ncbi:DUF6541 family protein [Arthrobacter sp. SDTb3-6]|uniref:DUF6541 family protein n=1 Tax=Arthrobacter sp. SDTb3-6 TaxID=2713571 RepID=UPI0035262CA8
MTWWQAVPAICTAAALLFVPGYILARGLGARGFGGAAMAPLASCGLVGVAGILGGLAHISWSVWLLAGFTIACTAAAWVLRRIAYRKATPLRETKGPVWLNWIVMVASLAIAAKVITGRLLPAMGGPDSFGQVFDNIFHLNAIKYILETGNASTLNLGNLASGGHGVSLYPSVWHSIAALVAQLASVNVFVAENTLTVAVAALLWPFACICLVRGILGPRVLPTVVAGILSAGFWIFPYQLLQWGPLFPNTLSYSILPLALLVVAGLCGRLREPVADTFTLSMMLLVGIAALFLTQPNGFSALLAFSVPILAGSWLRVFAAGIRARKGTRYALFTVLWGLAAIVALLVIWTALVLGFDTWKPSRSLPTAVKDVLTGGLLGGRFTWLASLLAAAGLLVILAKRRGWWMIGSMAVAGGLYVVAAYLPTGPVRQFLIGSWYQDPYRLAGLVPLFTIVLACVGVDGAASALTAAIRWLAARTSHRFQEALVHPATTVRAAGGLLALVVVASVLVPLSMQANHKGLDEVSAKIRTSWSWTPGWVVSADEYKLMQRLDKDVPADAVIGVDPFNGGSLAYAVSGRKVSQYHLTPAPSASVSLVAKDLATAAPGSATCRAAAKANIRYVLDFGSFYMLQFPQARMYPSFVNIKDSSTLKLVDQQGAAKLYKVVGC